MPKNSSSDSVSERRLRPIYDWLDNGNNKKALQEADKVLKKHAEFECCQVLRCLALMRLGREDEAAQVLDRVLAGRPVDEGALNAMTIAFRELQEPGKICQMYEGAVGREPANEEFLTHLFMSYVRVGEYKKQEEAARSLYKVKPKNPYFFWSVMSLVLQAMEGDAALGRSVHLPLAHRKVAKMAADGKMEQEQEVLLYLLVLELREEWAEGLEVLEGKLGAKLAVSASYRAVSRAKRRQFQQELGRWAAVGRGAREEVEGSPDQWAAYTSYLAAVRRLQEAEGPAPEGLTRDAALLLVRDQQTRHGALRGPWLAGLELLAVLGDPEAESPALILDYFEMFGSKHVAFSDLRPYLALLGPDQQEELAEQLTARWAGEPASAAEIARDVNLRAVQRFCGGHRALLGERAEAEVSELVARWRAVQPLVADLLPTDLRPSDSYLVMAGHLLWDLWLATGLARHFLRAATLLHLGAAASPSNWQIKLLLIRLYGAAGCGGASATLHGDLDIKHLMLDSLGWLLPRQLWAAGHTAAAAAQHDATVRLYQHVNKDTADHIITAYRSGTFYQIRDIYRLRTRIQLSHHQAAVETERELLQLLLESTGEHGNIVALLAGARALGLGAEDPAWQRLRDNRDLDTMVSWDPEDLQPGAKEDSFRLEVMFTRCRHLLLRSLAAACEEPSAPGAPLAALLGALRGHWTACQEAAAAVRPPALPRPQAPDPPLLVPYCASGQLEPVLHLLEALCSLPASAPAALASLRAVPPLLTGLGGAFPLPECGASLPGRARALEQLMWGLETLGLLAALLTATAQAMGALVGRPGRGKGRKGKGGVAADFLPLVGDFNLVQEAAEAAAGRLEGRIQELEAALQEAHLAESLELLGLAVEGGLGAAVEEGEQGREVLARMEGSYRLSMQQMRSILEVKRRYLAGCRIRL